MAGGSKKKNKQALLAQKRKKAEKKGERAALKQAKKRGERADTLEEVLAQCVLHLQNSTDLADLLTARACVVGQVGQGSSPCEFPLRNLDQKH